MKLNRSVVCFSAVLVASVLSAGAQTSTRSPDFYALRKDSTYESGCFPPCLCPILIQGPLRGGFRLTFTGFDGLFNHYLVDQVKWTVRQPSGGDLHATGSGTYRIGGEFALQHQLTLDLQVGSDPVQRFDSGLVTPPTPFPAIDARISIYGEYCRDTVFDVRARPVRDLRASGTTLYWSAEPQAEAHDVVWGSLRTLLDTGGDYAAAVSGCLANDLGGDVTPLSAADPPPGEAFFFLLRDVEGPVAGSFDSGSSAQWAPSDDPIDASPVACP